jgi:hypothetical protein
MMEQQVMQLVKELVRVTEVLSLGVVKNANNLFLFSSLKKPIKKKSCDLDRKTS